MGQSQSSSPQTPVNAAAPTTETGSGDATTKKPACKACCACPETKRARDTCIMEYGEENCGNLIEAHKRCMRDMGFNI